MRAGRYAGKGILVSGAAALLFLSLAYPCRSAEIIQTLQEEGNWDFYVRDIPGQVTGAEVLAWNYQIGQGDLGFCPLFEEASGICCRTVFLIDNSVSISGNSRSMLRQVLHRIVDGRITGELFEFWTFSEEVH